MTRCLWQLVYYHFRLLLHNTADFDAVGQCATESVQTGGETAEVDCGLVLDCCHAAAGVVEDVDTFNLAVSFDGKHAGSRVGEDGHPFLGERLIIGDVVPVAVKAFGCCKAERDVVDVVDAEVARIARGEDIAESDIATGARIRREVYSLQDGSGGGRVVDSGDRHEGTGVGEVGHDTHLELVFGSGLSNVEGELEYADIAAKLGHGEYATLVEDEGVAAAVSAGGVVIDHGLVHVGHGHILVCESPAVGSHTGFGGGGGSVGVEVVGVGELVWIDGAASLEPDVIDVVEAEVAGIARGEDVAESDIMAGTSVVGEVDCDKFRTCGTVVDGCDGSEGVGIAKTVHDTHLELVFGSGLPDVEGELECAYIAIELGHSVDAALVEDEGVVAAVSAGGVVIDHGFVLVGHGYILVCEGPAVGSHAGLGGGAGGVAVEVVGIRQVCCRDGRA